MPGAVVAKRYTEPTITDQNVASGAGDGPSRLPHVAATDQPAQLADYIQSQIVGQEVIHRGPFGERSITYCDYTASGKALQFIEDLVVEEILPTYANTHSTSTVTAEQTTLLMHEARSIVRNATRASEHDAVIFTGKGTTAAVNILAHAIQRAFPKAITVIVGLYEHHSNLLPWYEIGAKVRTVTLDSNGMIDLEMLETILIEEHQTIEKDNQLIGAFSACSNVSGQLTDVNAVSKLLHKLGALAFWDYAAAAPYVDIHMNPVDEEPKDAVYFSGHKFVGGPASSGVLICNKSLFKTGVPTVVGGGAVFFVRRTHHSYLQNVEYREEAGTPDILGNIRLGLVVQLKEAVGTRYILRREQEIIERVNSTWLKLPNLSILGNPTAPRLPIYSFVIKHSSSGLWLHTGFVTALLDDLFGIQTRHGCMCAGPYAGTLLGLDETMMANYEAIISEDPRLDRTHLRREREYSSYECLRPGLTRLNFPYFMPDHQIDFVVEAVRMVAELGWRLLPQYKLNPETAEWHHRKQPVFVGQKWLGNISYQAGRFDKTRLVEAASRHRSTGTLSLTTSQEILNNARDVFAKAESVAMRIHMGDDRVVFKVGPATELRWFLLSSEAQDFLIRPDLAAARMKSVQGQNPINPLKFGPMDANKTADWRTIYDNHASIPIFKDNLCENGAEAATDSAEKTVDDWQLYSNLNEEATAAERPANLTENGSAMISDNDAAMLSSSTSAIKESVGSAKATKPAVLSQPEGSCSPSARQLWTPGQLRVAKRLDQKPNRQSRYRWVSPPSAEMFKPMLEAIEHFQMIRPDDRILVCLSGGKDSLSLLHAIRQYQFYARGQGLNFEFGAITIDPGSEAYDPSPLVEYLAELNVTYLYEEQGILEQAKSTPDVASICAFCSRMKRGRMYAAARKEKWNVLAFGQHLDDLAESFLMSAFYNGSLRTIKAHYEVQEKDLRVIRPLCYVREKHLRRFAELSKLPVIPENCPACFQAPTERHRMKQLLASQEVLSPDLFPSLRTALRPLMAVKSGWRDEAKSQAIANLLKLDKLSLSGATGGCEDEENSL